MTSKLSDFKDPFALDEPLAHLRKTEWEMGNGQCNTCEGLHPGWAYGMSASAYHEPHETGHKRSCSHARAIVAAGQSVFWKRARTERKKR